MHNVRFRPKADIRLTTSGRLWLAFLIAPAIPAVINAVVLWPVFVFALVVGLICAYALTAIFGIAFVTYLRRANRFSVWPIVVAAGVLAMIPDLSLTLSGMASGGMQTLNDEWGNHLVWQGKWTSLGLVRYLVIRPLVYWLMGAVGGVVFWLIAIGYRPVPRKDSPA